MGNSRRDCCDKAARFIGQPGRYPHELRHTAVSLAIAAGATVKSVHRMLGHAFATLTWTDTDTCSRTGWTTSRHGWIMPCESDVVPMWSQANPSRFGVEDQEAENGF